jgi:hypothetical protein
VRLLHKLTCAVKLVVKRDGAEIRNGMHGLICVRHTEEKKKQHLTVYETG